MRKLLAALLALALIWPQAGDSQGTNNPGGGGGGGGSVTVQDLLGNSVASTTTVTAGLGDTVSGSAGLATITHAQITRRASDANYSMAATDQSVCFSTTFSTSRTLSMQASTNYTAGQQIVIADCGAVNGSNYLIIAPNGTDTINGVNASIQIQNAYGAYVLQKIAVGAFIAVSANIVPAQTCASGQFFSGLSANGAWTCAAPSVSTGAPGNAFISGALVTQASNTTINVSAGVFYDPSSSGVITCTAASGMSAGSLGANQPNQVYGYSNSGTCTYYVENDVEPPSSGYYGTARQDGSSHLGRWIGSFFTDASSHVLPQNFTEKAANQFQVDYTTYDAATAPAPFRIINGATNTTFGSETSAATVLPAYVLGNAHVTMSAATQTTVPAAELLSTDGTNANSGAFTVGASPIAPEYPNSMQWVPFEVSTPGIYARGISSSSPISLDIAGYQASR